MTDKISRRNFIENTSLGMASIALAPLAPLHLDKLQHIPKESKEWLKTQPIIMVGCWDSFPLYHIRRQDGNPDWFMDTYKKQQEEDTVKRLADIGVTLAIIHFYKGFGLKAEQDHIKDALQLTEYCHKYNIRVGVYIGSTIGYETFLLEEPQAKSWFVPPYLGRPATYGDEEFRKLAYFMVPEYMDYLKKVIRIAVKDFGADLLHFDNTSLRGIAEVFQHPLAKANFLNYLNNKYTEEERKMKFGFSDMTYVETPIGDQSFAVINDPMRQAWIDFRCQQLADFCEDLTKYASQLNPGIVIEHNPSSGFNGFNTMWQQGIDYPRLLKSMDIAWTEAGTESYVTDDDILISQIRTYKAYIQLNNKVFTYTNTSPLKMAEAMTFNRQCLGFVGDMLAGSEMEEVYRRYIRFYLKHFDAFYRSVDNIADVAILHTYATMAHNSGRPYQSTLLFEQTVIQGHLLWDMIFDQDLHDLSKYKVLVLADQESLSDSQVKQIESFVRQGGGLVITEHSSLYKPPHRRRSAFGLKDILTVAAPKWPNETRPSKSPEYPEPLLAVATERHEAGKGRVVYVPEVIPEKPKPLAADMTSEYWHLPKNWEALVDDVKWASGDALSLDLKAPQTVVAELMRHEQDGTIILHLLNYDVSRQQEVTNIEVSIQLQENMPVKSVQLWSPDQIKEQDLAFNITGNSVRFKVPALNVYDMVSLKIKD